MEPTTEKNKPRRRFNAAAIARYTQMPFTMGIMIAAGTWLGRTTDAYLASETPIATIFGVLLGVFGAMYAVIKEINKQK